MNKFALIAVGIAALLAATGCASTNRIVGHNLAQTGHWYGELGITGDGNRITVESGSRLTKLSVLGDSNIVNVEDRCALGKIEMWGEGNTVHVSDYLVVRVAQWGQQNQVIRRGSGMVVPMTQLAADRSAQAGRQSMSVETTPEEEYVDQPAESVTDEYGENPE
jgi:hypothetical protein